MSPYVSEKLAIDILNEECDRLWTSFKTLSAEMEGLLTGLLSWCEYGRIGKVAGELQKVCTQLADVKQRIKVIEDHDTRDAAIYILNRIEEKRSY